jgi:hypothetical protein
MQAKKKHDATLSVRRCSSRGHGSGGKAGAELHLGAAGAGGATKS